ncbi:serine/threonine protein kinase [Chamaesiphon minutus]|uniref:Protein kinase family protein n=1 Tax=Chamaesiphon minutus (strain ATCC 27169 / PCC 6605) TaxID=1173020 RepID=K9UK26_CHAP6|nr:serine/threonine-protein kinase [Chamaesiphon minutus]AFY95175.1 protein kinase family protein [Chamaesiphon minutus PCC 6605]
MQNSNAEIIGQVLCDRYQIEKQLGQKTGRRTFLAIDLQTESPVVIKLLIFNNEFIWEDLKLFEREAETLKHLELPAIPRYLDYFEFDLPNLKGFALVQTYIDAPSLEEVVSSGRRFTEGELQEFAASMLDILDYLHSLQPPVIHRDIKPSNILLSNRSGNSIGEVYLVDFGSVQNVAAKDGGTMTVVGTYGYMPMEQFGGKTVPASDLYSLGATLIYTIAGTHPADLPQDDGKIQLPVNNLSKSWRRWVETMTEVSLKKRFPDVIKAKLALDRLGEPEAIVRQKPYGSKIALIKNPDRIEIVIPDRRFPIMWGTAIALSIFFMPIVSITLSVMVAKILGSSLTLFFAYQLVPSLPFIYNFTYYFCGKLHLQIDDNEVKFHKTLFGLKVGRQIPSSPRSKIDKLTYNIHNRTRSKKKISLLLREIVIRAGVREYRIHSSSEAECEWLLAELSEWINLPVSK